MTTTTTSEREMGQNESRIQGALCNNIDISVILERHRLGTKKRFSTGNTLYWEGDTPFSAFLIVSGKVKTYCMSSCGKLHTYGIYGPGDVLGTTALVLKRPYESTAQALSEVQAYVISEVEFNMLLTTDEQFNRAVMCTLATLIHSRDQTIRSLGLMNVQDRLQYVLVSLAREHGIETEDGMEIDLDITHQALAELVAASRPTVTKCLGVMKRQGYIQVDGRHLILTDSPDMRILDRISEAVRLYDAESSAKWAQEAVRSGVDASRALEALVDGMRHVEIGLRKGDFVLPDLMLAALAMQSGLSVLNKELEGESKCTQPAHRIVVGTAPGDIHYIGKMMVSALLVADGFEIIDLGIDVRPEQFIESTIDNQAQVIAISALLTSSTIEARRVIDALEQRGLRPGVKVMLGGGAMTPRLAEMIGADGYASSALEAPNLARRLLKLEETESLSDDSAITVW
jgi:methylmalonyl-CoA mutase cobalamin-binding domain/chain